MTISPMIEGRGPSLPRWRDAVDIQQTGKVPIMAYQSYKDPDPLHKDPASFVLFMTRKNNIKSGQVAIGSSLADDTWSVKTGVSSGEQLLGNPISADLDVQGRWRLQSINDWDRYHPRPPSVIALFSGTWGEDFLEAPEVWAVESRFAPVKVTARSYQNTIFVPKSFSFVYDTHDTSQPLDTRILVDYRGRASYRRFTLWNEEEQDFSGWTRSPSSVFAVPNSKTRFSIPYGTTFKLGNLVVDYGGNGGWDTLPSGITARGPSYATQPANQPGGWASNSHLFMWSQEKWREQFNRWAPNLSFATLEECYQGIMEMIAQTEAANEQVGFTGYRNYYITKINNKRIAWGWEAFPTAETDNWDDDRLRSELNSHSIPFGSYVFTADPFDQLDYSIDYKIFTPEEVSAMGSGGRLSLMVENNGGCCYVNGRPVSWYAPALERMYSYHLEVYPRGYSGSGVVNRTVIWSLGNHHSLNNIYTKPEALPSWETPRPRATMNVEGTTYGWDREYNHDPEIEALEYTTYRERNLDELRQEAEAEHQEKLQP